MKERITIRIDFVDGVSWTECGDDLPLCCREYSSFPISVSTSIPVKAVVDDNRIIDAVYVCAVSGMPNNDGSRCRWEGWIEKTGEADDFSCVEGIFEGKTINVLRWHYPKHSQMPTQKECIKNLKFKIQNSKLNSPTP